jgi:hypothetical protein
MFAKLIGGPGDGKSVEVEGSRYLELPALVSGFQAIPADRIRYRPHPTIEGGWICEKLNDEGDWVETDSVFVASRYERDFNTGTGSPVYRFVGSPISVAGS